jgi:hypothetical protein
MKSPSLMMIKQQLILHAVLQQFKFMVQVVLEHLVSIKLLMHTSVLILMESSF